MCWARVAWLPSMGHGCRAQIACGMMATRSKSCAGRRLRGVNYMRDTGCRARIACETQLRGVNCLCCTAMRHKLRTRYGCGARTACGTRCIARRPGRRGCMPWVRTPPATSARTPLNRSNCLPDSGGVRSQNYDPFSPVKSWRCDLHGDWSGSSI